MARLVLILNGSPLADSSVSRMLDALADGVREAGAEPMLVRCHELHVKPCMSCGPDATEGWCIFHDDMDPIYEAIVRAHAVVAGSPIYFDSVSAPLKAVIDRTNCMTPLVRLADGRTDLVAKLARTRRAAFVTSCSAEGRHVTAERVVRGFFKWIGARWERSLVWINADDSHGSVDRGTLDEARALGRHLAQSAPLEPEVLA